MAVTLTDEQAKNSAASLRASAASSIATADLLDPPVPVPNPPPTIPPAGDLPNLKLIFEDQFLIDCKEGEFLTKYGPKWTAYPVGWRDTSKKGNYNPGIISVSGGIMTMRLHTNSAGAPQVCAPEPKINGTTDLNQLYGLVEWLSAEPVRPGRIWWTQFRLGAHHSPDSPAR